METQEVDYVPPDAFRKIDFDDVTRDRDNPVIIPLFSSSRTQSMNLKFQVGYLHFEGREEPLYKEKTLIGRDSDSDIIIDSPVSLILLIQYCVKT
jgi:hypothetical protein